jgi:HSP20 family protein
MLFGKSVESYLEMINNMYPTQQFRTEYRNDTPPTDIIENDTEIVVAIEVPGYSREDIQISLDKRILTIQGEKKQVTDKKKNIWHCSERLFGTFKRSSELPANVDEDKIEAEFKDGVLTIKLPKIEAVKPKQIEIK